MGEGNEGQVELLPEVGVGSRRGRDGFKKKKLKETGGDRKVRWNEVP